MSCLVNSPSWEGRPRLGPAAPVSQDMAASVSALEIFADRQPVDFGLTARLSWQGTAMMIFDGEWFPNFFWFDDVFGVCQAWFKAWLGHFVW